ncbi:glycosyltransferase family 2 protein [Neolewinella persica]|uniref:glycosyltransferase family 2 protein n=1 Tax=Neolewinella persica TaxID=70998 RepID=UPI0003774D0F|nr:glycosyltransferase family 2 protein [Neolewinella persica]
MSASFAPAILLLNFNGLDDTIECLESLRAADLGASPVFLLDNGSAPGNADGLRAWNATTGFFEVEEHADFGLTEPGVAPASPVWKDALLSSAGNVLLINQANLGFAAGNNLLTHLALARGFTEVLLLNNDTTVSPGFLTALASARQTYPTAVLIPQIRLYHHPDKLWNCGGQLRWPGRKKYFFEGAPVSAIGQTTVLPVSFVTGCALLYQPAVCGLLTERFFFGEEDMEFSLRLRQRGIPAFCIIPSVVFHKVGSSLTDNYRKSEVFTLRRLVNLRQNTGPLTLAFAYPLYLVSLFRLLIFRYGLSLRKASSIVFQTWRRSLLLDTVGKAWCVNYVRNGALT